jgi:hypothetical protein
LGVLLSHLVRDASHGGIPLWWPLPHSVTIPVPLYYAIQTAIGLMAYRLAGRAAQTMWMDWVIMRMKTLWG